MKILLILTAVIVLSGCSKNNFDLNEEFVLKYGQTATVNNSGNPQLEIEYRDISEESRCAPGTECIWAGRVAVVLRFNNQTSDTLGLNHSEYIPTLQYQGKIITLLDVVYSSDENFGKKEKSSIKLKVE